MDEDRRRYLRLIETGLGDSRHPSRVVVAGAGMAGLSAALLLKRAGHSVTILEARTRVGGRVRTLREPFTHGLHAEAGAMRIPESHALTLAFVRMFGLATAPFVIHNPRGFLHLNGRLRRMADVLDRPEVMGVELAPHERGRGLDRLLEAAIGPLADRIARDGDAAWADIAARHDELSVRDFLKSHGWSEGALELFGLMNNYETLLGSSFVEMLRDEFAFSRSGGFLRIAGGMDLLPNSFLPELAGDIRFGARVTALERKTTSVVVHYRTSAGAFAEVADDVILTLPFPVLRHIHVTPPFSAGKRRAIRALHYDASTKLLLQFRERFWETEDGISGGRTVTDQPIRNIHYPVADDPAWGRRGVLLTGYTWGPDSQRWSVLPPAERLSRALEEVARIHGDDIRELFEGGASKCWHDDEFAGGAYALFQPGQQTTLHEDIIRPEGRVRFAGEHTTLKHAWIEGAVESGLRAAEAVHADAHGADIGAS